MFFNVKLTILYIVCLTNAILLYYTHTVIIGVLIYVDCNNVKVTI